MNVVMIVLDAVRADYLPGWCGPLKRAAPSLPNLAALGDTGVAFDNHFTPVLPTQPACTSLLSGAHPLSHRVIVAETDLLPNARITWLPLLMRHHGWTTVAVDTLVDRKPWFARGCEYYVNPRGDAGRPPTARQINERAIEWLSGSHGRSGSPFFMFLRYQDAHLSWEPGPGHPGLPTPGGDEVARLLTEYNARLTALDDAVGDLTAALRHADCFDDTLLIVVASHGLELAGAHGVFFDAHGLYDGNLRVPMLLHWPAGLAGGRRVSAMTQHQDLAATVLDAAGAKLPPRLPASVLEGRSLLPLARGETVTSHWNQTLLACESTWQAKWALRTAEYKLIVSREPDFHGKPPVELYDLLEDPGESRNIAEAQPMAVGKLLAKFDLHLAHMLRQRGLQQDPIRPGRLSRGKRMFARLGLAYPPRVAGWKGHPPPALSAAAPVPAVVPTARPLAQGASS